MELSLQNTNAKRWQAGSRGNLRLFAHGGVFSENLNEHLDNASKRLTVVAAYPAAGLYGTSGRVTGRDSRSIGARQSGSSLRTALMRELTGESVIAPGNGLSGALRLRIQP